MPKRDNCTSRVNSSFIARAIAGISLSLRIEKPLILKFIVTPPPPSWLFGVIFQEEDGVNNSGQRSHTRYVFPHNTGQPSAFAFRVHCIGDHASRSTVFDFQREVILLMVSFIALSFQVT
jgi:hypothetical protein